MLPFRLDLINCRQTFPQLPMLPNLSLRRLALLRFALPLLTLLVGVLHTTTASADRGVIKLPGRHPDYSFDAEPHLVLGLFDYGPGDDGFGLGFRGTIPIVDNGFISSINNSVGIGFGADWTRDHFRVPLVMQWNFWLSRNWSVFGEPGGLIDFGKKARPHPAFYAGGRFHFTERITLTMRVGHPTASIGVSFLL